MVRANQWAIVATVSLSCLTGNFLWLLIPFLAGLAGLTLGINPILLTAKQFLRKPLNQYACEDRQQLRFNQTLAVVLLALGLVSYLLRWTIVAYVATAMVGIASAAAIAGFCVGCLIRFQWNQYRYRRSL